MNILHLNTHSSGGGAATAVRRLHQGLLDAGEHSQLVSLDTSRDGEGMLYVGGGLLQRAHRAFFNKLNGRIHRLVSKKNNPSYTSFSLLPSFMGSTINAIPRDIMHLHWVHEGFLTPWDISRLHGPLVWSMHDMWPFTGGCHYSNSDCTRYTERCGTCPELCSHFSHDVSRLHWQMKHRALQRTKPVIIAPSREHAAKAASSGMFTGCRMEMIPNCCDINVFKPFPKAQARQLLNLPECRKVILFGAMGATSDYNKGFDLLRIALESLGSHVHEALCVVFGSGTTDMDIGFPVHFLGRLHDDVSLALAYSAADVFICPSRVESFSLTTLEALSCGTPVAAFSVGGIPDMVEHGVSGYIAVPHDPLDLAAGIAFILADEERRQRMGQRGRKKVEEAFSMSVIAKRHVTLYEELLAEPAVHTK